MSHFLQPEPYIQGDRPAATGGEREDAEMRSMDEESDAEKGSIDEKFTSSEDARAVSLSLCLRSRFL